MYISYESFNTLKWYGRTLDHEQVRYFDYSSSGFEFCFTGTKAVVNIASDSQNFDDTTKGVLAVYIKEISSPDEYTASSYWEHFPQTEPTKIFLTNSQNIRTLYESKEIKTVVVKVIKISEAAFGCAGLKALEIEGVLHSPHLLNESEQTAKNAQPVKIEFIGDSITCGYGIEGVWEKDTFTTKKERADKSYAFLTARLLNADFHCCSWSGIGIISNYVDPATVNLPETNWLMPALWPYTDKSLSLRLGIEPEVWDESKFSPDIVVINLGTNDTSWVRSIEDRRLSYVSGLRQLIEAVHRRSPKAKICCCLGIMGQELCPSVQEAVKLFSKDFPKVTIKTVTFPVQDEADGIAIDWHPSAASHKKAATLLAAALKDW